MKACVVIVNGEPIPAVPIQAGEQCVTPGHVHPAHVAQVRGSLRRGEPQFQRALAELEAEANRALQIAPMSVMDKEVTPPSGDKHDYMSQAPYFWPDPSKPNGLPSSGFVAVDIAAESATSPKCSMIACI